MGKVPGTGARKSKSSNETELQESGGSSSQSKEKVSKKESVNVTEKRSRKVLEEEDLSRLGVPNRAGFIVGASNRFYESAKKAKRKKLRAR